MVKSLLASVSLLVKQAILTFCGALLQRIKRVRSFEGGLNGKIL